MLIYSVRKGVGRAVAAYGKAVLHSVDVKPRGYGCQPRGYLAKSGFLPFAGRINYPESFAGSFTEARYIHVSAPTKYLTGTKAPITFNVKYDVLG
jgi:hypothetical protein